MCVIYSEQVDLKYGIDIYWAVKSYLTHIQSQIFLQPSRCLPILQAQYKLLLLNFSICGFQGPGVA